MTIKPSPQPLPPEDRPLLLAALSQVETMISHELTLIGNRMTWFAISQSFLFGAYATIATDPVRLKVAFKIGEAAATSQPAVGRTTITVLLLVLPLIGALFATAAWLSVHAASVVLSYLDPCRGELIKKLNALLVDVLPGGLPVMGDTRHRSAYATSVNRPGLGSTIAFGRIPQYVLPGIMVAVWLMALVLRFKV